MLQPTQMSQGAYTSSFSVTEIMNIVISPILLSLPESSLFYPRTPDKLAGLAFNIDNVFSFHISFKEQYSFLKAQFWSRIFWSRLQLGFLEVQLFLTKINALRKDHEIESGSRIKNQLVENSLVNSLSVSCQISSLTPTINPSCHPFKVVCLSKLKSSLYKDRIIS